MITSDGGYRGTKSIPMKGIVDEALESCPSVKNAIILEHTKDEVKIVKGRDLWWHDVIKGVGTDNKAEVMDSEDILFILYTSGLPENPRLLFILRRVYVMLSIAFMCYL